jgi:hypothetical protein
MNWIIENSKKSMAIVNASYRDDHYRESVRTAMGWLLSTGG